MIGNVVDHADDFADLVGTFAEFLDFLRCLAHGLSDGAHFEECVVNDLAALTSGLGSFARGFGGFIRVFGNFEDGGGHFLHGRGYLLGLHFLGIRPGACSVAEAEISSLADATRCALSATELIVDRRLSCILLMALARSPISSWLSTTISFPVKSPSAIISARSSTWLVAEVIFLLR